VCTAIIAVVLGLTVAECGRMPLTKAVGKLIASAAKHAPREQDGVAWRMGEPIDLGPKCAPRHWTFVDFHAPPPHAAAAAPIDHRAMALFLITLDQQADRQSLGSSILRGGQIVST
jgi:hypothetical protein